MDQSGEQSRQKITKEAWSAFLKVAVFFISVSIAYISLHVLIKGGCEARLNSQEITTATYLLTDSSLARNEKFEKTLDYIVSRLRPIDNRAEEEFRNIYGVLNENALFSALPNIKIITASFYWLSGDKKYLEVVFWAVFGVLANLLYYASENMRTGKFRPDEIPVYLAKIVYAPVVTIVIILGYNYISPVVQTDFESYSHGIIVVSFVLGFFSGRAVGLLGKLKDVILPSDKE